MATWIRPLKLVTRAFFLDIPPPQDSIYFCILLHTSPLPIFDIAGLPPTEMRKV